MKQTVSCSGSALGIGDSAIIADSQLRASSAPNPDSTASKGRLNQEGAWIAFSVPAWIDVDLLGRPTVTGVILQGRSDGDMWTTTFKVQYSQTRISSSWTDVLDASGVVDVSTCCIAQFSHHPRKK